LPLRKRIFRLSNTVCRLELTECLAIFIDLVVIPLLTKKNPPLSRPSHRVPTLPLSAGLATLPGSRWWKSTL